MNEPSFEVFLKLNELIKKTADLEQTRDRLNKQLADQSTESESLKKDKDKAEKEVASLRKKNEE